MNAEVLRRLHIRHASILDQAHCLKLELSRKLPPLHDAPPVPSKHLTRCLRNRVQAKRPRSARTKEALGPSLGAAIKRLYAGDRSPFLEARESLTTFNCPREEPNFRLWSAPTCSRGHLHRLT